jgi:hypothetical protein
MDLKKQIKSISQCLYSTNIKKSQHPLYGLSHKSAHLLPPTARNTAAVQQIYHSLFFTLTWLPWCSSTNPETQAIHFWDLSQEFSTGQTFFLKHKQHRVVFHEGVMEALHFSFLKNNHFNLEHFFIQTMIAFLH